MFTQRQVDDIGYEINEWYLDWKKKISLNEGRNRFGETKEELKIILFPVRTEEFIGVSKFTSNQKNHISIIIDTLKSIWEDKITNEACEDLKERLLNLYEGREEIGNKYLLDNGNKYLLDNDEILDVLRRDFIKESKRISGGDFDEYVKEINTFIACYCVDILNMAAQDCLNFVQFIGSLESNKVDKITQFAYCLIIFNKYLRALKAVLENET